MGFSILPQPPSFNKKKNYEIHEVLGEGTFGKVAVGLDCPNDVDRIADCTLESDVDSASRADRRR